MTTGKPTRQQLIDVLHKAFVPHQVVTPEDYVEALVRAGIAEGPGPEPGFYRLQWSPNTMDRPLEGYWDGSNWYMKTSGKPTRVIERILPPND